MLRGVRTDQVAPLFYSLLHTFSQQNTTQLLLCYVSLSNSTLKYLVLYCAVKCIHVIIPETQHMFYDQFSFDMQVLLIGICCLLNWFKEILLIFKSALKTHLCHQHLYHHIFTVIVYSNCIFVTAILFMWLFGKYI